MIGCKNTAHNSAYNIADISELRIDRSQHISIFIGKVCTVIQSVVLLIKFINTLFFMTKDLYNLLAFHHFFDVAIDHAEGFLLCNEIFAA